MKPSLSPIVRGEKEMRRRQRERASNGKTTHGGDFGFCIL
jgi:hypothetical protein